MKVQELFEDRAEKPEPGTYAAVKFDDDTVDAILKYMQDNDIPNPLDPSKLHCTVLYSRKHCPDYKPLGDIDPPWVGTPTGFDVWESRGKLRDETPSRCLVLKFDCPQLQERHKELMDEHDATYDFPEYKTHVTLSYNIGDLDQEKLPKITSVLKELSIVREYGEDLDLDWSQKTKGTS